MISSLEKEIKVEIQESYGVDSKKIFSKLESILRGLDLKSSIESDKIKFKKVYKSTTDLGENKDEAMKILRSGEIKLSHYSSNKILIAYKVNLDALKFMSVLMGILIVVFMRLMGESNFLISIFAGLIILIVVYSFGYLYTESKMNNLINKATKMKTKPWKI